MKKDLSGITFSALKQTIVFGFNPINKKYVYIDNCENGLNCGLVCGFCGNQLNAKNRCVQKINHFSHKAGSDCKKGHESTIPLLLQKVLNENKFINIIPYRYPEDPSIFYEFGIINIENVELEKYEMDLSFNVIAQMTNGMKIAFIPYMKSSKLSSRIEEARKKYDNVMVISFVAFENTDCSVEDIIKEIIANRNHSYCCSWAKNMEEANLKEKYNLKCEKEEKERKRQLDEYIAQRIKPVIDNGVTYYHIEGIEALSSQKDRIMIESKDRRAIYLINFNNKYKTENGLLLGRRLCYDGTFSDSVEIIENQKYCLWKVR